MSLIDYYDSWGLLAQSAPERDGGDSCQRVSMYFIIRYLQNKEHDHVLDKYSKAFDQAIKLLYCGKGRWCRHPDPLMWYGHQWNRMSRDQLVPLIIALGYYGKWRYLLPTLLLLLTCCLFTTNTRRNGVYKDAEEHRAKAPYVKHNYSWKLPDIGITLLPLFIRASGWRVLYPLLWFFDLELLAGAWLARKYPNGAESDANNYICRTLQAKYNMPTWWSTRARSIYRQRPHQEALGYKCKVYEYNTDSGPLSALQYYFRPEKNDWHSDPPLDLLYKDEVEAL